MSSLPISPNPPEPEASQDKGRLTCPSCGRPHLPGALLCLQCGTIFSMEGRTLKFDGIDALVLPDKKPAPSEISIGDKKTITCHIGDKVLTLNVSGNLVLGRSTGRAGDPAPDIDLTPYGGIEKGVSRRHVQLQNKNQMLYVLDLGSSNGTWLNGRLLFSQRGRPLYDGDELRLGRLKIRITFG